MKFKSRISTFYLVIVATSVALLTFSAISAFLSPSLSKISVFFAFLISITVIALLISISFTTKYRIENNLLKYRSGPFYGKINIETIKELRLNTTKFIGLKIALATKGITVKYNKWDEIYISPAEEALFVEELIKVNPQIIISNS